MKATYKSKYNKPALNTEGNVTGVKPVYTYELHGTPEEIKDYTDKRVAAGSKVTINEQTKLVIAFSDRYIGKECDVKQTANGKWFLDSEKFDIIRSSISGGDFALMVINGTI